MIGLLSGHTHGFRSWWDRKTGTTPPSGVVAEMAFLEQGGAIVTLQGLPAGACFALGPIYVPEAAIRALEKSARYAWPLVLRHIHGDWGAFGSREGTGAVARQNLRAIQRDEGRVVSEFGLANGGRLWIITHLGEGGYTTFLPSGSA
jgi:hypothetical protein